KIRFTTSIVFIPGWPLAGRLYIMESEGSTEFRLVFKQLQTWGLLLESDAILPSVSALVAGAPVRGSWWGHPRGDAI
ncbi:hypothetical protein MYX82_10350, partial [Acidobacteria bacterium AH-259-D05]|nr:hypothetical protein [Acidobacteria bacterium AH-259-D05]